MLIIHIKGTMCAGKTWTYEELMKEIPVWDIYEFYVEMGCCSVDGRMNWDGWKRVAPTIQKAINNFIHKHMASGCKMIIIESGGSADVQQALAKHQHTQVELVLPSDRVLKQRARKSKRPQHSVGRVLDFAAVYKEKYAGPAAYTHSPEAVKAALKKTLKGGKDGILEQE